MRSVIEKRKGLGELEERTYVSCLKRLCLPYRGLGHWKRPKPSSMTKKSARELDAGGRDVTIATTMNLDRLQVHRKWEMSAQE